MIGTAGVVAPTMIFNVPLAVPPEVPAESETVYVPAVVGVPEIVPVEALTESPAGSPDALKTDGERVAAIV